MKFSEVIPLNELFQTPVAYKWSQKSTRGWEGAFVVNELTFEVFFAYVYSRSQNGQRVYLLEFVQGDDMHNTGKSRSTSVRVFATVIAMLREFITTVKPTEVMLHGKNGEKDSLYSKMAKALQGPARELGYEVSETSDDSEYKSYHIRQIRAA